MLLKYSIDIYRHLVTVPRVKEGVSLNSQILVDKTFLSFKVFGTSTFSQVNSPLNLKRVLFGPLKSFGFFQT